MLFIVSIIFGIIVGLYTSWAVVFIGPLVFGAISYLYYFLMFKNAKRRQKKLIIEGYIHSDGENRHEMAEEIKKEGFASIEEWAENTVNEDMAEMQKSGYLFKACFLMPTISSLIAALITALIVKL